MAWSMISALAVAASAGADDTYLSSPMFPMAFENRCSLCNTVA
jgi:hypothetical protein